MDKIVGGWFISGLIMSDRRDEFHSEPGVVYSPEMDGYLIPERLWDYIVKKYPEARISKKEVQEEIQDIDQFLVYINTDDYFRGDPHKYPKGIKPIDVLNRIKELNPDYCDQMVNSKDFMKLAKALYNKAIASLRKPRIK